MNYWLVKQEPADYSWDDFVRAGKTAWTGVRNFAARNHLKGMKPGDRVFYYHSGEEKQIMGIAAVKRGAYPDPTAEEGNWVCVDLEPVRKLEQPVTLATIKSDHRFKNLPLVRQGRLSVMPVSPEEFGHILKLGNTAL